MKKSKSIRDEDILATLHLSGRQAAKALGVNESSVRRRRNRLRERTRTETVDSIHNRVITLDDARELVRKSGDNPDDYSITIKAGAYGDGKFTNQILLKEKKA